MIGPGKYDDLLTAAREKLGEGTGALLIVFEGNGQAGFSCQATPEQTLALPHVLRAVADSIAADVQRDFLEALRAKASE